MHFKRNVHAQGAGGRSGLPPALLPVAVGIFLFGGLGPNVLLALFSVVVLVAGCALLWRPGEVPVLLFVFCYQWLQASVAIFHANWLGVSVADYSTIAANLNEAIGLSLAALLLLAIGMNAGAGLWQAHYSIRAREIALSQPLVRWFSIYIVASAGSFVALTFAYVVPGLSQPMLAAAALRWAFFFMLAFAALVRRQGTSPYFIAAFGLELLLGVGGYFSDFKAVLFFTLFAVVASGARISLRGLVGLTALAGLLLAFGIVWTAVKSEYRGFVSSGQAAQVVDVDYLTRMAKLGDLVGALDGTALADAADQLVRRISYTEFFGAALNTVPAIVPHEGGAILLDAIVRPFMPRMFFPEKTAIDDSLRTNLYTGGLAGDSEGTSISLGYVAELYIDFGEYLMMGVILVMGYAWGRIYAAWLRWREPGVFLGMGLATANLAGLAQLENSFTKAFGGLVVSILVAWLIVRFVVPRWCPWVTGGRES